MPRCYTLYFLLFCTTIRIKVNNFCYIRKNEVLALPLASLPANLSLENNSYESNILDVWLALHLRCQLILLTSMFVIIVFFSSPCSKRAHLFSSLSNLVLSLSSNLLRVKSVDHSAGEVIEMRCFGTADSEEAATQLLSENSKATTY